MNAELEKISGRYSGRTSWRILFCTQRARACLTDLLFSVCEQFGIRYYSATPKERYFVEEVARVTWARQKEQLTGIRADVRPVFA